MWLPAYGAVSLVAGLGLLVALVVVLWPATGELVMALFRGDAVDIAIGLYHVVPLLLGVAASTFGLLLATVASGTREPVH